MKASPRDIYHRLLNGGLSHAAACGVLGNIEQESSFRTDADDGHGSFGLCQWLGIRKRALERYARVRAAPITDWEAQIDFLLHELASTEIRAGKLLNAANTAVEAAGLFCRHYERPANYAARMKKREEAAARFAAEFS